ncbi:MAG: ATP-binding protein [Prevotella sp.]
MKRQIILENRMEELDALTAFVQTCGETWQLKPDVVFNIQLALEECVTNVIMYAYPTGEKHTLQVTAELQQPDLVLTIEDSGVPFDPTQVAEVDTSLSAEERPIGGLGVFLVRQLTDSMEYRREKERNLLTLRKRVE